MEGPIKWQGSPIMIVVAGIFLQVLVAYAHVIAAAMPLLYYYDQLSTSLWCLYAQEIPYYTQLVTPMIIVIVGAFPYDGI